MLLCKKCLYVSFHAVLSFLGFFFFLETSEKKEKGKVSSKALIEGKRTREQKGAGDNRLGANMHTF